MSHRIKFVNKTTQKPTLVTGGNGLKKIDKFENKKELNKVLKEETKGIVKNLNEEEKKVITEEKEKKKKQKMKNSDIISKVSQDLLKSIIGEDKSIEGSGIVIY